MVSAKLATESIWQFGPQAVTADVVSPELDVSHYTAIQIEINCTAAAAAINIVVERKGPDGIFYPIFATAPTVAGGAKRTILIAPGVPAAQVELQNYSGASELPGQVLRVTFDITTSATFSADVMGR